MNKIGIFTSGGDAPGMNACIRAAVRTTLYFGKEAIGIERGYEGIIEGVFNTMDRHSVSNIIQLGGTILYSARSERFKTVEGRRIAYENLKKEGINSLIAIGGDGTFTGANIFMHEYPDIAIVGCPGTIDNDLYGTDYTIGYLTAINTAMDAIDKIKDTANSHDRLFFVEVMGRDAGFIALRSAIATGAEAVLIPESKTDIEGLISTLKDNYKRKRTSSIVIVAEGDELGGAKEISELVRKHYPQLDSRVTILGHIQRGGRPTCLERVNASRLGMQAVKALLDGKKGVMVGIMNNKVEYTPFEKAIKYHQSIDPKMEKMLTILG